ncbi:helix-turn-helix domain-containing protein [bacterium LRH843]|nr:helix-turn-helix domain-containing protein [bacterium LRH843]
MVGLRIKVLREEKGYSINELSEKANVSKSYLSSIERGIQINPSLQVLQRLATSLDTNVENILEQRNEEGVSTLDDDWLSLFEEAIQNGVTKEDFARYLEFIRFTKRNGGKH